MNAQLSIFDGLTRLRSERGRQSKAFFRLWMKGKIQGPPRWIHVAYHAQQHGETLPEEPRGYIEDHLQGL